MIRFPFATAIIALTLPLFTSAAVSNTSGQETLVELQAQIAQLMTQLSSLQQRSAPNSAPSQPATPSQCPNLARTLSRGMKGADVTQLQQFLIQQSHLAPGNATGFFGTLTEAAVKKFQAKERIVSSGTPSSTGYGTVGTKTRAAIAVQCKKASIAPSYSQGSYTTPGYNQGSYGTTPSYSQGQYYSQSSYASCAPLPQETRTQSCPAGQSGAITQIRTSICAIGATSPTWREWVASSDTCVVIDSQNTEPLIGAFRWDAWYTGNLTDFPQYLPSDFYSKFSYREPINGWFDAVGSNAQSMMDAEINAAADAGLDYWAFDDYSWTEYTSPEISELHKAFKLYKSSSVKHRIKFSLATSPNGANITPGYFRSTYVPYLITQFSDPQYLKVNGNRPVVFMLSILEMPTHFPNWTSDRAYLKQKAQEAGFGEPLFVDSSMDIQNATASGFEGVSSYGVMGNGAKPETGYVSEPGSPYQHAHYATQKAKDVSNWNAALASNLYPVLGITAVNDSRAITTPYGFYIDEPSYREFEDTVKEAYAFMVSNASQMTTPALTVIYAWNELSEGGPGIVPTKQHGKKYLDAIKAVKTGNYPNVYKSILNGDNRLIERVGNWTYYGPSQGAFNNDYEISQWAGDTAIVYGARATEFKVIGVKGPTSGKIEVFIDGTSQGVFDLYSADWQTRQTFFSGPTSGAGLHQLKIVNVSTDTTKAQVSIDSIEITEQR